MLLHVIYMELKMRDQHTLNTIYGEAVHSLMTHNGHMKCPVVIKNQTWVTLLPDNCCFKFRFDAHEILISHV